jgi:LysM repeat protein
MNKRRRKQRKLKVDLADGSDLRDSRRSPDGSTPSDAESSDMKKPLIIVAVLHVVFVIGIIIFLSMNDNPGEEQTALGTSTEDAAAQNQETTQTPEEPELQMHTVNRGELLTSIARRYGVSVSALAEANELGVADIPEPGSELVIPDTGGAAQDQGAQVSLNELIKNAPKAQKVEEEPQPSADAGMPSLPSSPTGIAAVHHNLIDAEEAAATRNSGSGQESAPAQPAPEDGYRVQQGDTLWSISQKFGTTPDKLMAANGINDPKTLKVGQLLQIPGDQ